MFIAARNASSIALNSCQVLIGERSRHDFQRKRSLCISNVIQGEKSIPQDVKCSNDSPTYLLDAIHEEASANYAPFFFPGHKQGAGAPPKLVSAVGAQVLLHDLPELPALDNLSSPEGVIFEAQQRAARIFGAGQTFFLVNGSTVGVQAAVMALCGPGTTLVLSRNAHQCAVSAMVLTGAIPHYVPPVVDTAWGIALGVSAAAVRGALDRVKAEGAKVGAVLIVSPTYHGLCSDIAAIVQVCHQYNVPLIVDEAHGAHFRFNSDLPPTALAAGADIVVQSTHKVLGAMTQAAMLHCRQIMDIGGDANSGMLRSSDRVGRALQVLQSSSPSYILLASLDAAGAHMASIEGREGLARAIQLAVQVRNELEDLPGLDVLPGGSLRDPLRITVSLCKLGLSGHKVDEVLCEEFGVVAELPSLHSLTFVLGPGTIRDHTSRMVDALRTLSERHRSNLLGIPRSLSMALLEELPAGRALMSPRDAFFSLASRVAAEDAIGHPCAELLCPYPPGIPCIAPGEEVTQAAIDYLRRVVSAGGSVSGAGDPSLATLAVLIQ